MNAELFNAGDAFDMANFSAQENLLYIRQKLSDEMWEVEMRQRTEMGSKRVSKKVMKSLVEEHIMFMMKSQGIETDWKPGENREWPLHPASRREFGEVINVSEDRIEKLEKDSKPEFTLREALAISGLGNMDIGTFLTPNLVSLMSINFGNVNVGKGSKPIKMYQWVMWLRGFRPLPEQDLSKFLVNSLTPSQPLTKVDRNRLPKNPEQVVKEKENVRKSPFVLSKVMTEDVLNIDGSKSNPFSVVINLRKFNFDDHKILIRITLALSTIIKKLFRTKNNAWNKRNLRDAFSPNKTNFQNLVSKAVVVLIEIGE